MIVGITGTLGAGKGNLVKALQEADFNHFSVRGFLTQQLEAEGKPLDRDHMVGLANELRAKHSPSYIAEQLYERAKRSRKSAVIESLRTPGEVQALKDKSEFYLIAVDAPIEDRYQRVVVRGSSTDKISFEEFKAQEDREMTSTDPTKQNLSKCREMADYYFWSDFETPEHAQLEFTSGKTGFLNLFEEFTGGKRKRRPTFPEMYIRQAFEWTFRSTCLRRQVGAKIINEEHNAEISQGYNGAPKGIPHCEDRGGCYRQKQNIPSGQQLERCFAAHAELNAVSNASILGRPVVDATMYVTNMTCNGCAILGIQTKIGKIIHLDTYPSEIAEIVLKEANVKLERYRQGVHPKAFPKIWG